MDKQDAIDRILETENLTDNLQDDDAEWLIQWGIGHLDTLIAAAEGDDQARDKVDHLMAAMRTINQIVADRAVKSPEQLAHDIHTFLLHYARTFGESKTIQRSAEKRASSALAPLSPREAMLYLIRLAG